MKQAYLVQGLGYGDEGKGATVDWLTSQLHPKSELGTVVVRYNGGSQAAHNVVTPDGRHHCFQQFGSGTFIPGVRTHLSRFMLVNPINMTLEEEHLKQVQVHDAWKRTSVDPRALVITPYHRELNRLAAAARGKGNTCGAGVGFCREFHFTWGDKMLFAGDLLDEMKTINKLRFIRDRAFEVVAVNRWIVPDNLDAGILRKHGNRRDDDSVDAAWLWYRDWRELLDFRKTRDVLRNHDVAIFEGAQGVLLDELHGEPGYNTWTNCTFDNAEKLISECCDYPDSPRVIRIGVSRTYHTRHGSGPLPTEDPALNYPEPHNGNAGLPGIFRQGHFDRNLFVRGTTLLGGIDVLAINHLDQLAHGEVHQRMTRVAELDKVIRSYQRVIGGAGPTRNDRYVQGDWL